MYTIDSFITDVINKLPDLPLGNDIADLSSDTKKTILIELFKKTSQVDGWFVWSGNLYKYNAEANIIERIYFDDISGYDEGQLTVTNNKPIVILQSTTPTSSSIVLPKPTKSDGSEIEISNVTWEVSFTQDFIKGNSTTVIEDEYKLNNVFNNLVDNIPYYIRVVYTDVDNNKSEYSDPVLFITLPVPESLIPYLTISNVSDTEWDLSSITDNGGNVDDLKEVSLSQLKSDTLYGVKVRMKRPDGTYTEFSPQMEINITPAIRKPDLIIDIQSSTSINVSSAYPITRDDFTGTIDGMLIEYSLDNSFTVAVKSTTVTGRHTIESLDSTSTYFIRARYISNDDTESGWSDVHSINTNIVSSVLTPKIEYHTIVDDTCIIATTPIVYGDGATPTIVSIVVVLASSDNNFIITTDEITDTIDIPIGMDDEEIHVGVEYNTYISYTLDNGTTSRTSFVYKIEV